jgi:hypothetical protein
MGQIISVDFRLVSDVRTCENAEVGEIIRILFQIEISQ